MLKGRSIHLENKLQKLRSYVSVIVLCTLSYATVGVVNSFVVTSNNNVNSKSCSFRDLNDCHLNHRIQQQQQHQNDIHGMSRTGNTMSGPSLSTSSSSSSLRVGGYVPDGPMVNFGEESRRYRRDVFSYGDWVRHRDSGRFIENLLDIFNSGILLQLTREISITTTIATLVVLYNALLVTGYDDLSGIHHDTILSTTTMKFPLLAMPAAFFTLTGPALSLLQVFKTNTAYQRWDEARKNWGSIINNSRTIMREGATWVQKSDLPGTEKHRLMARLAAAVWLFPRAMTRHLLSAEEDDEDFATDCRANLNAVLAEDMIGARHKPTRALYELSCAINEFPLTHWRRINMDKAVTGHCDCMGSNERLFTSPIPRSYTKHTARFVEVWLLFMPFTLYSNFVSTWNSWATIPATAIMTFFLLGIEELGIQLEEPFTVLPMHKMTNGIGISAEEHVQWFLKDDNNER